MTRDETIKFINQYEADWRDGFVSNIDSYIESMMKDRTSKEINQMKDKIKSLPYTCLQCAHLDTNICIGCTAPYE